MEIATRESFGRECANLGENNKNMVALTADLYDSTNVSYFADKFPDRYFDLGIAEQDLVGTSAGLALCNKIPFVFAFAIFIVGRAYDQLRTSICYPKLNVKIIGSHGGLTVGEDGASHQMLEDINIIKGLPNINIFAPCDDASCRWVANEILKINGPVYVRLARQKVESVYEENEIFEFGKGKVHGDGKDVAIFTYGTTVQESLKAKKMLEEKGLNVRVIDMITLKPIDKELIITTAKEVKYIFTVEDHSIIGGLGSIVADVLCESYPKKIFKLGVNDVFGESGSWKELLKVYELDGEGIAKNVLKICNI